MGAFQGNMLEAFNSLREDFQKSLQKSKQVEGDQTSSSASKQNPSHSKDLDPSKKSAVESMDVDYGPELPPRLDSYDSRVDDASGHPLSSVEEPSRVASTKPKKSSHFLKHFDVVSPVSSPQASPKVETSNRLKQAQHFSTHRKVQNGNSRVHQDLPDSRGMGTFTSPSTQTQGSISDFATGLRCSSSPPFLSD